MPPGAPNRQARLARGRAACTDERKGYALGLTGRFGIAGYAEAYFHDEPVFFDTPLD